MPDEQAIIESARNLPEIPGKLPQRTPPRRAPQGDNQTLPREAAQRRSEAPERASGLVEAFSKSLGEQGIDRGAATEPQQGEDTPKESRAPEEGLKPQETTTDKPPTDEYSFDGELPLGSTAVKDKFKRLNTQAKEVLEKFKSASAEKETLAKQVEELTQKLSQSSAQPVNVEESEAFKALQTDRDRLLEIVETTQLDASPRFQEKYISKIRPLLEEVHDFALAHDDAEAGKELITALMGVAGTPAGRENQPDFYKSLTRALRDSDLDEGLKEAIKSKMNAARDLQNERHAAILNWKSTKKDIQAEEVVSASQKEQTYLSQLDTYREEWKSQAGDILKIRKEFVTNYDEYEQSTTGAVKKELSALARTGVVTKNLLGIIHNGIEAPVVLQQFETVRGLASKLNEENKELKATIERLRGKSPGADSREAPDQNKRPIVANGSSAMAAALSRQRA